MATWNITTKSTMNKGLLNSDVVIEPELSAFKNTSLDGINLMVQEGYDAAKEKMPEIKEMLKLK